MLQIEYGLPTTLGFTFELDGVAANPSPDSATITITGMDGTVLIDAAAATNQGVGEFSYVLAGDVAPLGVLTVEWTATFGAFEQTQRQYVEVVGGFYFAVSEARAKYPALEDKTWDEVADARAVAEEIIEHACNVAFVRRAKKLTLSGEGKTRASIPIYMARAIQSVAVDGEVQTVDSSYRVGPGAIYRTATWRHDISNVDVIVEHGFDYPPARIKDAAIMLAYHRAVKGPIDDRATSMPAGEAGGTITLLTPGVGNAITGLPEVDAAIIAHRLPPIGSVSSVPMTDSANTYPSDVDSFAIG